MARATLPRGVNVKAAAPVDVAASRVLVGLCLLSRIVLCDP